MSLRSRILAALLAITLVPLLGIAVWACLHAFRWSGEAVQDRLARSAERAGAEVTYHHAVLVDALQELGATVLEARATGGTPSRLTAAIESEASEWRAEHGFIGVEVREGDGGLLYAWREDEAVRARTGCASGDGTVRIAAQVGRADRRLEISGVVAAELLLPASALPTDGALIALVDREAGVLLADPACALRGISPTALRRLPDEPRGAVRGGDDILAWQVAAGSPGWTVLSLPGPSWPAPFSTAAINALLIALFVALAAGGAFFILIRDLMRSMAVLTTAATRIGHGDFSPWLPPPGEDEVGRLSLAIGAMAGRLDDVMAQNARSRQMAAIGEMASHVSHEIRNPLSSIRLNLQSIEREIRTGEPPADLHSVVSLCLRETNRLEATVSGVLRLAGVVHPQMTDCRVQDIVDEAVDAARAQFGQDDVRLRVMRARQDDWIRADCAQMRAVFLNLFRNAHDAMRDGGTINVWSEVIDERGGRQLIRVHVTDEGTGVPPEVRDRIFDPFYTTKTNGSGIGLPISARTLEAHGGRLYLEQASELERGAHFVVELRTQPPPRFALQDSAAAASSLGGPRALGVGPGIGVGAWRRPEIESVEPTPATNGGPR